VPIGVANENCSTDHDHYRARQPGAVAERLTINRRHVVGCRDSDVYDRIISMISAGNREAATALIARMLGTGECIIWDEAQRVRPEESGSLMVWEALGKARNWQDTGAWLVHWHRFIDHIASGKTLRASFQTRR
jgi:hypothetical protein